MHPKTFFKIVNLFFHPLHTAVKHDSVTTITDITYDPSHEYGKADLHYIGDTTTKKPVLINIHGGGFIASDKKKRIEISQRFAEMGYFVYTPNYRLVDGNPFFTGLSDCITAINFLVELKDTYNLDLDNICISGDSAGAYLALQTYICQINKNYQEDIEVPKSLVKYSKMLLFGVPINIVNQFNKWSPFNLNKNIAEYAFDMKMDKHFENIVNYKHYDKLDLIEWLPSKEEGIIPTMIVHSKFDYFCAGDCKVLYDKLKSKHLNVRQYYSTKFIDNHCFHLIQFCKSSKECLQQVDDFLHEDTKEILQDFNPELEEKAN